MEAVFLERFSKGLTPAAYHILSQGRKDATKSLYYTAWERWCHWCDSKSIDRISPTVANFVNYLAELCSTLRHTTVATHKSAILTLMSPSAAHAIRKSDIFQAFMQGLYKAQPRAESVPIWDIDTVLKYLADRVFPMSNPYELGRHIALLMLLFGGRRVHDLSLLSIAPNALSLSDTEVILQPKFGSKTDKPGSIQSPLCFVSGSQEMLNVPLLLQRYLTVTQPIRGSCTALFIVPNAPQPANVARLRNWVQSLLELAGVNSPPGSTRSAVATAGALQGLTIEQIMERGNWKSASVVYKHYLRF
jgi:hypothetical protein